MPTATAPTKTGYLFGGYYTGSSGSGTQYYNSSMASVRTWTITSNSNLYANWIQENYVATLSHEGGFMDGRDYNKTLTAQYGVNLPTVNKPSKTGYIFQGYYTAQSGGGVIVINNNGTPARGWPYGSSQTIYASWLSNGLQPIISVPAQNNST